jgi:succinoglycan biosynthesis protein ExoA
VSDVLVTVLIPAKDEALWVGACLASVAAQDYPHHLLEVIVVVDGITTDATAREASAALARSDYFHAEVVRHASAGTPANLNTGLARAQGEVVCRVDARSRIPRHYVRRCVELLQARDDVAVVGGAQVAVAPSDDALGRGIARALNNRWGMGLSRYRRGARSGVSDTVYLGAFRTADLRAADGWCEELPTNQDFDLNRRLGRRGVVWFDASLAVEYVPRSTLRTLHRQYERFGSWKVRYWRLTGDRPRPRQLALAAGVPALLLLAGSVVAVGTPRHSAAVLATALAGATVVEMQGTREREAGVTTHACALLALVAVTAGWIRGVWSELLR